MNTSDVKTYLLDLQARIVAKLESLDGKPFGTDAWTRNEGGEFSLHCETAGKQGRLEIQNCFNPL